MCYAVCIEIIWTSMKKMICFEDQNCQFIMILWYMYIVTLYTRIKFSTYGDIFIILNKKMY